MRVTASTIIIKTIGMVCAGIERFQAKCGMRPCTLVVLILGFSWVSAALARDEPYRVLLLHSYGTSLPITADWYEGIVRGFSSAPELDVEIDTESPDLTRFDGMDAEHFAQKQQFQWLLDFYRRNYQERKPHLIIATDTPALRFLLVHGEDLFPGVPVVFVDADRDFVNAQQLPPNVTGITAFPDVAGTLELILRVHPDAQRVAVVVGSGPSDKEFARVAQPAIESFADRVEFVWLHGMPVDELVERLNAFPERTVALYLVQFQDRTGRIYVPRAMLRAFAAAARVPVYGLWDTLLEHGIVGVRLATVEEDGDLVRANLSSELGFSKEHRDLNIRRIGFVAAEITRSGGVAICAPIAPYDVVRREVREMVRPCGGFVLVHVATPLETCEARDRKGMYAKARAGIIKEFTGISDPYEAPKDADVVIDTTYLTPDEASREVLLHLEREGYISAPDEG